MSFKNSAAFSEIFESPDELGDYLRQHTEHITGLRNMKTSINAATGQIFVGNPETRLTLLRLRGRVEHDGLFTIHDVMVDPDYRGKGLGALGTKALLCLAAAIAAPPVIKIHNVITDGPRFWTQMGGLTFESPMGLPDSLLDALSETKDLSPTAQQQIQRIATLAENNPYLGFRLLSQIKPQANETTLHAIQARIMNSRCFGRDLMILPGEASTRPLLEQRLGQLPPFPPLDARNGYSYLGEALYFAAKTAPVLAL